MVRLGSLNARGMREEVKRKAIFNFIEDSKCNVCCLQDTHSTPEVLTNFKKSWKGDSYWHHGTSRVGGVGIIVKQGLKIKFLGSDKDGRILFANILEDDQIRYTISCVYAPTTSHLSDQLKFLQDFIALDKKYQNSLRGGDFNSPLTAQNCKI